MLSFVVAAIGLASFAATYDIYIGLIFAAYLIIVTTYLMLLGKEEPAPQIGISVANMYPGVLATMHQPGSPLRSGRLVLWRTIPFLFLSPLLSSLVNGHDLEIYLPVSFTFLVLTFIQYRSICKEWSSWMVNIPDISEKDISDWYTSRYSKSEPTTDSDSCVSASSIPDIGDMQAEFRRVVMAHLGSRFRLGDKRTDPVAARIAKAMPYIDWLFAKDFPNGNAPIPFSSEWLNSLSEGKTRQKQLARGLKEHNPLLLFRASRYDVSDFPSSISQIWMLTYDRLVKTCPCSSSP